MLVNGSRIGKEKVADSKTSGYLWTGPSYPDIFESARFSFRIQKFPRPNVIGLVEDLLFSTLDGGFKNIAG